VASDGTSSMHVDSAFGLLCPECGLEIPVGLDVHVDDVEPSTQQPWANFVMNINPDLSEVWAHAFTHNIPETSS
jgi:hypothetical protein